MNLQTKQIDLDSEVRIFEYDAQIFSCCHVGGGMGFDSEGNLYVTTGDSNSSQNTGGYSGNFQPQRCPTGPADQATNTHCGANNVSFIRDLCTRAVFMFNGRIEQSGTVEDLLASEKLAELYFGRRQ